jgi:imidazolonepropionase-like amidohydrolase
MSPSRPDWWTRTHLAFEPGGDHTRGTSHDGRETVLARMREHALAAVRAGVTTVRDLGDRDYFALALRATLRAEGVVVPEIVASGPPITSPGGNCWFLGGEAEGPPRCGPPSRNASRAAST